MKIYYYLLRIFWTESCHVTWLMACVTDTFSHLYESANHNKIDMKCKTETTQMLV